ncbi:hypothetical protein LTR16_003002 [Cryomyces antarcticus]|uniref:Uncharacterized protein n=1 Tax=Cryomyces antarcticus TaxID=329879 RepID=A0ABR0M7J1_9PEZI|nr:hypothetical protein LTR60_002157 [Cryomyces antarcticus]KAK5289422.1 hypothetical protein LTR16_003002 [Cryomyces antarcticus]
MLSKPHDYGKRLLPVLIDRSTQTDHDRVYASISTASDNVVKGFRDITYKQLSNAIDHAAFWLDGQLGKSQGDFETFAYFGPRGLRYPILTVAAAKVGRKVLLPSLLATLEAQNFLAPYTWLQSAIGSTEGSIWPTLTVSGEDWSYMCFDPLLSARASSHAPRMRTLTLPSSNSSSIRDLHELLLTRPEIGHCFATSDLWAPHPDPQKPHLWRYAGRVDDLVVLMGEVELNAAPLEQRLQSDPIVHAALVGGQGRTRSLLLLEIAEHKDADGGRGEAVREMVWPAVREGDEHAAKWTGGEGVGADCQRGQAVCETRQGKCGSQKQVQAV